MPCHLADRLLKIIVHLVHALRLCVLCRACDLPLLEGRLTDVCPVISLVRYHLRDDIHRALQRFLHIGHALLLVHIGLRLRRQRLRRLLCQDDVRQPLQPLLLRNAGARLSLGSVREIQVVDSHDRLRREDLRPQLLRELALLLDAAKHLLLLLLQISEISESLVEVSQHLVVERPRDLLAVSGDERDRVSLIYQFDGSFDLPFLYIQFFF